MLTIFTPAYNRAYILPQLYKSLCAQTCSDFEWLIVDDGSTDDTNSLIEKYLHEGRVKIRYFRKENGGKHRAINFGVKEAFGQWFFIVDSDDCLTSDAVAWIQKTAELIEDDNRFAGLSGIRIKPNGEKIGGGGNFGNIDANAIDIRLKYGVVGDLAEVYKTDILRQYPFPEIEGEKFCPEALVWFRIARQYMLRYCHKGIYVCEYLSDGLTAKITKLRRESSTASMIFYSEHFHDNISWIWKMKAAINFWRFSLSAYKREYRMLNPLSLVCWLPGKLMQFKDSI